MTTLMQYNDIGHASKIGVKFTMRISLHDISTTSNNIKSIENTALSAERTSFDIKNSHIKKYDFVLNTLH